MEEAISSAFLKRLEKTKNVFSSGRLERDFNKLNLAFETRQKSSEDSLTFDKRDQDS